MTGLYNYHDASLSRLRYGKRVFFIEKIRLNVNVILVLDFIFTFLILYDDIFLYNISEN